MAKLRPRVLLLLEQHLGWFGSWARFISVDRGLRDHARRSARQLWLEDSAAFDEMVAKARQELEST